MYRKRPTLPARARALTIAIATAGVLLAGCGDNPENSTGDAAETTATDTAATSTAGVSNNADVEFAQQMIPHHAQAVDMAEMVPDRDVSPELVELAEAIEAAQQPEIDQMTAMLQGWGEDVPSTDMAEHGGMDMDMEGMMSTEDMDALDSMAGAQFERTWLTMMIEHHEGAIAMAETELAEGSNTKAQALARQIIDAQEAEITTMKQLRSATS